MKLSSPRNLKLPGICGGLAASDSTRVGSGEQVAVKRPSLIREKVAIIKQRALSRQNRYQIAGRSAQESLSLAKSSRREFCRFKS